MTVNSFLLESMPLGKPPSNWKVVYLKDVTSKIGSGATPRGGAKVYQSHGISLIRSQNVHDHKFLKEGLAYIDEEKADKLNNVIVEPGDILLNITGDSIARCCVVPNWVLPARVNQHVAILRPTQNLDSIYLQKYLCLSVVKNYMLCHDAGGTRKALTKGNIKRFLIPLPPLPEQKAIARILGTLDDKIELNQQMNRTLEATARAIFKSWFVDFDPVRAKMDGRQPEGMDAQTAALFPAAFEDSELGMIPKVWRVVNISEIAKVIYGASFSSKLFNTEEKGLPLVRIRDLPTNKPQVFTDENHPKGTIVNAGDILVGMDGEFRAYVWQGATALLNQRVCKFFPEKGIPKAFLLHSLIEPLAFYERSKVGTTVIHLGKGDIDTIKIILPHQTILQAFGKVTNSLFEKILVNSAESNCFANLRDTLLPKLMSGELRVVEAEKMVEDMA